MDGDDRAKTGCVGILIPTIGILYGIQQILHPRMFNRFTGGVVEGEGVTGLGIGAIGLSLMFHAFGFVPYQRVFGLKYLIATIGLILFVTGLLWKLKSQ